MTKPAAVKVCVVYVVHVYVCVCVCIVFNVCVCVSVQEFMCGANMTQFSLVMLILSFEE